MSPLSQPTPASGSTLQPLPVEAVIERVGGQDAAARLCGVGVEAVRKWRQSRAIPTRHWPALVKAAGIDFAALAGTAGTLEPASAPDRHAPGLPDRRGTAVLVLGDGTVFHGQGFGAPGRAVGEVCFTTGLSGYQETLTDPSFAGQILTFTFPHIGNVGTNQDDLEASAPVARGAVLKAPITEASNWRSVRRLDAWFAAHGVAGIAGLDTRALTRRIRDRGAPNGVLAFDPEGRFDLDALREEASAWPGLEGMDLAAEVTCRQAHAWEGGTWEWGEGFGTGTARHHVVAVDYGAKRNILRCLASAGCRVTVVPATATASEILRHEPSGVFLSNGPGDPAATGAYAVPAIQGVLDAGVPLFGICLGHQLLGLALGGRTRKLPLGHRGANHPVKDLDSGRVLITSQNHGFAVVPDSLPEGVRVTHVSLFDGTNEGLACEARRCFSVQFHPEASPGPHDAKPLFERFVRLMDEVAVERARA